MKIELKNVKIALHMSEETTAFTADIFVNGIKTGYAKNDGHGGCTFYHAYEGKRELLTQAERHAETLPSDFYEFGGVKREIQSNLEHGIDDLVDIHKEVVLKSTVVELKKLLEKAKINHPQNYEDIVKIIINEISSNEGLEEK
jgi:hypothetical protein